MPRIRAVVLLDQGGRCDWRPDTSAQSMQGFVDFARDPFFAGATPAPAPPPPTTRPPTTTVPATTTTVTPTTRAPTTTTPPNVPASTCSTTGGVAIGTGDDAQRVVDAHRPATKYTVKAGTHPRNFSVRPSPATPSAGSRARCSTAAGACGRRSPGATNVTLDSITVQQYNTGRQGGAIHPDATASGWVVRNVSAVRNYWAGLMAADGMRILGGHYNDNDQLGIGGNAATGIVLDGLDSDPTTFDGPEMARNHTLHADCGWEAGGMKWDMGQVTIRNTHVHDNECKGLWADINAHDALIEHNLSRTTATRASSTRSARTRSSATTVIYGNGFKGSGWYWAGVSRSPPASTWRSTATGCPATTTGSRASSRPARLHAAGPPAGRPPGP